MSPKIVNLLLLIILTATIGGIIRFGWNFVHTNLEKAGSRQREMASISIHPDLSLINQRRTGFPDSIPSIIHTYRLSGKTSLAEIRDYYQEELPKEKWVALPERTIQTGENVAWFFSKEDRSLVVNFISENSVSAVSFRVY